ncbi:FRG domain-containing protein [Rhodobacteraceae bacterium DSL-40]|uniref:FRG domain-containing protein n=1 Tax=Amaricoccus sp. B4 TaxID=3368557 RepID=UPI000DABDC16
MPEMLYGESTVDNLSEFVVWSRACSKRFGLRSATLNPWFRGQGDIEWPLKPALYRGDFDKYLEREMLRDFRSYAYEFLENRERLDIDWLFIAQHHGLPTRLLDWTENPLVSLYFSCLNHARSTDACVWALNPWELNRTTVSLHSVPPTDAEILRDYVIDLSDSSVPREVRAEQPIAIRPFHRFRRSNAQSGVFTIHGKKEKGIDKINFVRRNRSACLLRAFIPAQRKLPILKELYAVGVHHGALFQSIESVAEILKFRYGSTFFNK